MKYKCSECGEMSGIVYSNFDEWLCEKCRDAVINTENLQ
jgi:hypothetical protein